MASPLLVGTDNGLFAFGVGSRQRSLPGRSITALARARDGGWLAIIDRRFVVRSGDGEEWHEQAEFENVEAACLIDAGQALWIGTHPPHIFRWDGQSLELNEPFEMVAGKRSWFTPWGGPPEVRSLAMQPDGTLYANVHVGGIPRSMDAGASWEPTIDVNTDVHQVLVHPEDPGLLLAATARGLALSRDRGGRWEVHRDGIHGHYMSAVAVAGRQAFVTSSTGSSGNARSALYCMDLDAPGRFERCGDGLPEWFAGNINTFCLDARAGSVAFGTRDGEVFEADANTLRWRRLASDLPEVRCVLLAAADSL